MNNNDISNKDIYNFKYLNLAFNSKNKISRNNGNSLYNNSTSKINHFFNSDNSQGELEENMDNYNKKDENDISINLNNNIISMKRKSNFIKRNKSLNYLLKLKRIIDDNNLPKNKKKEIKINKRNKRLYYNNMDNHCLTYQAMNKNQ